MNKLKFKNKVLASAFERQQEIIDDFKLRIADLKHSKLAYIEDQSDTEQVSMDATTNELINKIQDQLNFALDEMNFLLSMKVDDQMHRQVQIGAIVVTDKITFFPSVSVEYFSVDGKKIFGISQKAPLFKEMRAKKIGDVFSYQKEQYKILDVY